MNGIDRTVVVGGGVVGAACAYFLAQDGRRVTILEQGEFGAGCSHGNCGLICPSHALPLTAPGAFGTALRSLFRPTAPFRVKPRFDPRLWSWLLRFAMRCNASRMLEAAEPIHALLRSSRSLYDHLFGAESFDCEWETRGLLFPFRTVGGMDHHAATAHLLQERFGLSIDRFDGAETCELEPALKPGLAGSFLYRDDAHLRPDKLLSSWRRILESKGVEIRERCALRSIVRERDRARAVRTTSGELAADVIVVATGAWTPFLERELGCRIPIQPGKGYSTTMARPARCPKFPLMFEEDRIAVTPMKSGYRLGSTMEFAGYDTTLDRRRLAYLRQGAERYLHEPTGEPVTEEWYGWRPMTYDSVPIIGRCPTLRNVWIAAGHNMLGVSMSPGTGKLIAESIAGRTPHLDPKPYSPDRFRTKAAVASERTA